MNTNIQIFDDSGQGNQTSNEKTFLYDGTNVTFLLDGDNVTVNVTQFAKAFPDKNLSQIVNSKEIQDYVNEMVGIYNYIPTDLLRVVNGGINYGTWAHRRVALRIAQKLSTRFAIWVDERIEELLKYGITATQPTLDKIFSDSSPESLDFAMKALLELKKEREEKARLFADLEDKNRVIELQDEELKIQAPLAQYTKDVLQSENTYTSTEIAKELDLRHADQFHKILKENNIMHYQSGRWMLTARYAGNGYTKPKTHHFTRQDGSKGSNTITVWTERGRMFLHWFFSNKTK